MRLHVQAKSPVSKASFVPLHARTLQRACSCGGMNKTSPECDACRSKRISGAQTKLSISQPGDRFEQEADRAASHVVQPGFDGGAELPVRLRASGSDGVLSDIPE